MRNSNNQTSVDGVILLAAGKARRFGSDKRLALLGEQPLLAVTLQRYLQLPVEIVVVVDAHPDERILNLIPDDIQCLRANVVESWGMGDSLALGADYAIAANWQRCLIALADMPFVQIQTLQEILHALHAHDAVVPVCQNHWGHPVGFTRKYLPQLAGLTGDRGAKAILQSAHPFELHVDDRGVLQDIDVPGDLVAHIKS